MSAFDTFRKIVVTFRQSKFGFSMIAYIALSTMKEFVYFGIDLHFSVRSIREGFIIL